MKVRRSIESARLIEKQLARGSPDLLPKLLTVFLNVLMSTAADAVCGAAYGM